MVAELTFYMQWLWLPCFLIFDYAIAVLHDFFVTLHSFLMLSMVANLLSRPHRSHPFFRPRCCFHCFESWDEQLEPARSQISSRSIGRHQTSDQDGSFTCMFPVFWWTNLEFRDGKLSKRTWSYKWLVTWIWCHRGGCAPPFELPV